MKDGYSVKLFFRLTAYFLSFAVTFALVLIVCSLPGEPDSEITASLAEQVSGEISEIPTVIIDAGHGGADSGATVNGVSEKDINLALALRLSELCRAAGIPCVLTRKDDSMLYTEESHKKAQDLKNRISVTENYKSCVLFSIHQNKFPQASCKGLQVYYSKNNPSSQKLALCVQKTVASYLQPDNTRAVKPAGSEIYLLDRAKVPAVIVECGFLSNDSDREKLQSEQYQTALCAAMFAAITYYIGQTVSVR